MLENGLVVGSNGRTAKVELSGGDKCNACAASGGCHANVDLGLSRERQLTARDPLGVHTGDRVEVYVPDQERLRAGLAVFGLPVVLTVAGAVVGSLFGGNLATGIGLVSGLVLGAGGAWALERLIERRPGQQPKIMRVLARGPGTMPLAGP